MLSAQDKGEIRTSYRQARDQQAQVEILTQLYAVQRKEIEDVLGIRRKPTPQALYQQRQIGQKREPYTVWPLETKRRMVGLALAGLTVQAAGEAFGVPKPTAYAWMMLYRRGKLSPIPPKNELEEDT